METTREATTAQKKGAAELLILAQLEQQPSHGYQIAQTIDRRSEGVVNFNVASLYPILYDLEARGLITGQWVEKPSQRRRRYYKITAKGQRSLANERRNWERFMKAMEQAAGLEHA